MGEFSPVQLDALEDALEDLELVGIPHEFEDDASVSGRLSEYRELLQFSREALPSVEVPPGVLDSVLAAARDEAARPAVDAPAAADDRAESKTPWWKRLSMWVPALAVGASAALVLVMVQGTLRDAEPAEATVATADAPEKTVSKTGVLRDRGDALQAAAEPLVDGAEDDARLGLGASQSRGRLRGSAALERSEDDFGAATLEEAEAEPEVQSEVEEANVETPAEVMPSAPAVAPEPTDKVIYEKDKGAPARPSKESKAKPSKSSPSRTSGKKQEAPRTMPEPAKPKPEPKPSTKPTVPGGGAGGGAPAADPSGALSSADGDRRKGRCSSARNVYRGLIDHGEAKIRARALAGLGLCALSDGDEKGADGYFSRARKADSGIGSFISRERDATEQTPQQAL